MTAEELDLDPGGTARARLHRESGRIGELARRLDLDATAAFVATELTRLAAGIDEPARAALERLVLASLCEHSRGSTRLPIAGRTGRAHLRKLLLEMQASDAAQRDTERFVDRIRRAGAVGDAHDPFGVLFGAPGQYAPFIVEGDFLYQQRMWELERRVASRLRARLEAPVACDGATADRLIADLEACAPRGRDGRPVRLSSEQRRAVSAALRGRITVISGGPGTGKTSIVVSILRALARRGEVPLDAVALAAPTGKAADRMRGSIDRALRRLEAPAFDDRALVATRPEARTLHRLLGYSPRTGRFRHHERNRLSQRFVIVDESSMIDLGLMDRLLRALADESQVVLLGDAHQLPSVDAGAVFRDLAEHAGERAVTLRRSFRMDPKDPAGRHILGAAKRIDARDGSALFEARRGMAAAELVRHRARPEDVQHEGVEWIEPATARAREAVLARWYATRLRALPGLDALVGRTWRFGREGIADADAEDLGALLSHFERSRVLCLTRGRVTGVEAVNEWFHLRARRDLPAEGHAQGRARRHLVPGEPVLVKRNDYERGLFNGDSGLVVRVRIEEEPPRLAAVFRRDEQLVPYPLDSIRSLVDPAWAITVHKAQGSEYEHVAILLPARDTPLLTRELLYTAVTRSSRSVLLVGSREMIELGASRGLERCSGIGERIAAGASADGRSSQPDRSEYHPG